jgi:hypothetical protein
MFPSFSRAVKFQILALILVFWSGVLSEAVCPLSYFRELSNAVTDSLDGQTPIENSVRAQSERPVVGLMESPTCERAWHKSNVVRWLLHGSSSAVFIGVPTPFNACSILTLQRKSPPLCDVARHERSGVLLV